MEEKREDGLISCLVERNPIRSVPKRKRRKPFKMMKELVEIKETHRPQRDVCYKHKKIGSCLGKRATMNDKRNQVNIRTSVMERAQEVQANLDSKFPSFVKPMIRSNVTTGFWLSLPRLFCDLHLPRCDKNVTLVDESRREYNTKYLSDRNGLSAGWRGFSIAHHLQEGDVLVFHLVKACKMKVISDIYFHEALIPCGRRQLKVYIVRANHFGAVEAALSLLHLQTHAKRTKYEDQRQDTENHQKIKEKFLEPFSQETLCIDFGKCSTNLSCGLLVDHNPDLCGDVALVLEGLVVETSNVAKAIKVCQLNSCPQNLSTPFECFKLVISQIRARLDQFVCIVLDPRNRNSCRNILDLSLFQGKVEELKEATQRLYAEAEVLKIKSDVHKPQVLF